jgi:hypothetical protein
VGGIRGGAREKTEEQGEPAPHGWSTCFGMLTPRMTCGALGKATGDFGPSSGVFFRLEAFPRPQNVTGRSKRTPK